MIYTSKPVEGHGYHVEYYGWGGGVGVNIALW